MALSAADPPFGLTASTEEAKAKAPSTALDPADHHPLDNNP